MLEIIIVNNFGELCFDFFFLLSGFCKFRCKWYSICKYKVYYDLLNKCFTILVTSSLEFSSCFHVGILSMSAICKIYVNSLLKIKTKWTTSIGWWTYSHLSLLSFIHQCYKKFIPVFKMLRDISPSQVPVYCRFIHRRMWTYLPLLVINKTISY